MGGHRQFLELEALESFFGDRIALCADYAVAKDLLEHLDGGDTDSLFEGLSLLFTFGLDLLIEPADQVPGAGTDDDPPGPPVEVTVRCELPRAYPVADIPVVTVSSKALSRSAEHALQMEIATRATSLIGQESLFELLQWVQDHARDYFDVALAAPPPPAAWSACQPQSELMYTLLRFHHIQNASKRDHIVKWAVDLDLTGFSRPGYPGVVLVEGAAADIADYARRLRTLSWKKMSVVCEEQTPTTDGLEQGPGHRRFATFTERVTGSLMDLLPLFRGAGLEYMFYEASKLPLHDSPHPPLPPPP